jgi:transcriptional regulator ATRX
MLAYSDITTIKSVLIVCPPNTVNNWLKEYKQWVGDIETEKQPKLFTFEFEEGISKIAKGLRTWKKGGGVTIIPYDLFYTLVNLGQGQRWLLDPGPDMVVCDEGHLLKNHKSMLTEAVSKIKTIRRVVLTGTPLQNSLIEYHTMVNFVKPNLLGSLKEFTNRFVSPIKNGQWKDSSERDVKIMKRRAHVLHCKLEGCVQRLDYSVLIPYLPPKHEYCIIIKLSEKQKELYREYLNTKVPIDPTERSKRILSHYSVLVKILAHPIVLTMKKAVMASDDEDEEGSLKDFIDDGDGSDDVDKSTTDENSDIELLDDGDGVSSAKRAVSKRKTRRTKVDSNEDSNSNSAATIIKEREQIDKQYLGNDWWCSLFQNKEEMFDVNLSGKIVVLQEILKTCENIGDNVLIFSQYLTTLNIVEEFLADWDNAATMQNGERRWRKGIEYFRIDGATQTDDLQKLCDTFNKKGASSSTSVSR